MARLLGQAEEEKDTLQREVQVLRQQLGLVRPSACFTRKNKLLPEGMGGTD